MTTQNLEQKTKQIPIDQFTKPDYNLQETLEIIEKNAIKLGFKIPENNLKKIVSEMHIAGNMDGSYILESKDQKYEVLFNRIWEHEWGSGGRDVKTFSLINNSQNKTKLFEEENYNNWDTTSDDTTDYDGIKRYSVALYQENPLARAIFEDIKIKNMKVNEK